MTNLKPMLVTLRHGVATFAMLLILVSSQVVAQEPGRKLAKWHPIDDNIIAFTNGHVVRWRNFDRDDFRLAWRGPVYI